MYYINIFFICSFLGFIFETVLCKFISPSFNSGILHGPWTFIYGIAIFIIMGLNKFLKEFKLKKTIELLVFYIGITVLMTLLEFCGGMLIEKLFSMIYWDYIDMRFNYGFYICLEVSLLWGLFATLVNYKIKPWIDKLAKKMPKSLTIIIIILFIIDILVSLFNL